MTMEITLSEVRAWCATKGRAVLVQPTGMREGAEREALRDITKEALQRQIVQDLGIDVAIPVAAGGGAVHSLQAPGYEPLAAVLLRAFNQAAHGKGKERHAQGEPFTGQVMQDMAKRFGVGSLLGQAFKKSEESQRLPLDRAVNELLGAINYLAGAVIALEARPISVANDNGVAAFVHGRCKCGQVPASSCQKGAGCNDG